MITMRFPGGRKKALTLSYDDGPIYDVRLVETMDKYGIKGTFNLNSELMLAGDGWHLTVDEAQRLYAPHGMEPASHTCTHAALTGVSPEERTRQLLDDRRNIERLSGTVCCGFAYPYGAYDAASAAAVAECGFIFARTVESTGSFDIPSDWLRLPATCHHDDGRLFDLADSFINGETDSPQLFYLWGHSYEFEENANWDRIERFCALTGGRSDVWYASNSDIFRYVQAFGRLVFSADRRRVFNPTAYSVCFSNGEGEYCVLPGAVLDY